MNNSNNEIACPANNLSFAGTPLESSYLPIFIASDSQMKKGPLTIGNGLTIDPIYLSSKIDSDPLVAPVIERKSFFRLIWEYIKSELKSFTKEQKLKEIRAEFNAFLDKSQSNFNQYKEKHESCLDNMKSDISIINRQKALMKNYLLKKLFVKLQEMGLECTFSDYLVEHIDLYAFPINDNYNLVAKENCTSIQSAILTFNEIIEKINVINPFFYIFSRYKNNKKINKIRDRLKELEKKEKFNTEQMNADLSLMEKLECALKNIACIYKDIMQILRPIMEKLLAELSGKYYNDFSQMPQQKVEAIRNVKDLLKDFSEVHIVPTSDSIDKMKDDVVKYSNNLSKKHYLLKAEILKVTS